MLTEEEFTSDPDMMEASVTKLGVWSGWWMLVVILASSRRSFWPGVYGAGVALSTTPCHRRPHAVVRRQRPRESAHRTSCAASFLLVCWNGWEFEWYTDEIT